jgi:hypothetical protein
MTRALLLAILATLPAAAAVIRGNVVENFTGKLLTRAVVVLEAMPGTPGGTRTVRTGRLGAFEFDNLAAGYYVLKASRRGFMPIEHGQKRWNSAGQPLAIEESATSYITLRLPRYSAVSGTVIDENEIGLPGHEVAVYRATQPPEHIRQATADDRGVYRIAGLEPGKYLVRSVAKQYEEGGYLPTFSRETVLFEQAQPVELFVEQQANNIDIRPIAGRLFSLTVEIGPEWDTETAITLASGMGRKTAKGLGARFSGLPPGDYEVYAESPTGNAYERVSLRADLKISLVKMPPWTVTATGGPVRDAKLRVRRKDLAGVGPEFLVPLPRGAIPPGRWELLLEPPDGHSIDSTMPYARGRRDGWLEVTSRPNFTFTYRLTTGAGAIRGVVKDAAYAPVFLEGYDPALKTRVGDLRAVRTDARGNFQFANLGPGTWRVFSTFEYGSPDSDVFTAANAPRVAVEANSTVPKDLELWVIR